METVLRTDSYSFSMLSVPFLVAGVAVLLMSLYVIVMQGAPLLRGAFLLVCVGLLPFVAGGALVGSTTDARAAVIIYRWTIALLPLAATGAMVFMLALSRRLRAHRILVGVSLASSIVLGVLDVATELVIDGVWTTPSGLLYYTSPVNGVAQAFSLSLGAWVVIGVILTARQLHTEASPLRRRQYRGAMVAFSVCSLGLVDVPLAYGFGWVPLSWVFLTLGALAALRSLIADDLIQASAIDSRAPRAALFLLFFLAAILLAVYVVGPSGSPFRTTLLVLAVYLVGRTLAELVGAVRVDRGDRDTETPLDRVLARYKTESEGVRTEDEIGRATTRIVELGVGTDRVELLLSSRSDYSWTLLDGEVLADDATPDPMILGWLLEHRGPLVRREVEGMRLGALRESVDRLFKAHEAQVLVPLVARDELVGLIVVGSLHSGRALRSDERRFLDSLQESAAAALAYARMQSEATARVEVDKEVELAAVVQSAFVPAGDLIDCGDVQISGIYAPASRCGGDWWSVHDVPGRRTLLLVGDVTGHGIPAAMVTAAAKGCHDVARRLMGADLDVVRLLELLHASVRRAGGGQFNMTCFATLIDVAAATVTYANAGHPVPYVCRSCGDGTVSLDVLAARGNPLGANAEERFTAHTRDIARGDTIIWYTDGIVECANPSNELFGDRRMQRILRKLDPDKPARALRDDLVRATIAFQQGQPADDDITLVVGRIK